MGVKVTGGEYAMVGGQEGAGIDNVRPTGIGAIHSAAAVRGVVGECELRDCGVQAAKNNGKLLYAWRLGALVAAEITSVVCYVPAWLPLAPLLRAPV